MQRGPNPESAGHARGQEGGDGAEPGQGGGVRPVRPGRRWDLEGHSREDGVSVTPRRREPMGGFFSGEREQIRPCVDGGGRQGSSILCLRGVSVW